MKVATRTLICCIYITLLKAQTVTSLKCYKLQADICMGYGYTATSISSEEQPSYENMIKQIFGAITACKADDYKYFVCLTFFPKCKERSEVVQRPCRKACEKIKRTCGGAFLTQIMGLNCENYTSKEETRCISYRRIKNKIRDPADIKPKENDVTSSKPTTSPIVEQPLSKATVTPNMTSNAPSTTLLPITSLGRQLETRTPSIFASAPTRMATIAMIDMGTTPSSKIDSKTAFLPLSSPDQSITKSSSETSVTTPSSTSMASLPRKTIKSTLTIVMKNKRTTIKSEFTVTKPVIFSQYGNPTSHTPQDSSANRATDLDRLVLTNHPVATTTTERTTYTTYTTRTTAKNQTEPEREFTARRQVTWMIVTPVNNQSITVTKMIPSTLPWYRRYNSRDLVARLNIPVARPESRQSRQKDDNPGLSYQFSDLETSQTRKPWYKTNFDKLITRVNFTEMALQYNSSYAEPKLRSKLQGLVDLVKSVFYREPEKEERLQEEDGTENAGLVNPVYVNDTESLGIDRNKTAQLLSETLQSLRDQHTSFIDIPN